VKGPVESVRTALESISDVESLSVSSGPEDGVAEAVLEASGAKDIRESTFRSMAGADLPILQMRPMDLSLEDIFLNLTTQEEAVN